MGGGVHFDWTISLGTVIQIAGFALVVAMVWSSFKTKVDLVLQQQAQMLEALTARLVAHEDRDEEIFRDVQTRITDLVGGVQRLVGQYEVFRQERRKP